MQIEEILSTQEWLNVRPIHVPMKHRTHLKGRPCTLKTYRSIQRTDRETQKNTWKERERATETGTEMEMEDAHETFRSKQRNPETNQHR